MKKRPMATTPIKSERSLSRSWGSTLGDGLQHHRHWLLLGFAGLALILAFLDSGRSYEHPGLLLLLNAVFYLAVSLAVSVQFATIFLRQGTPGFFFLANGVAIWGLSGLLGVVVALFPGRLPDFDGNALITIHNSCVWLAAMLHLLATIISYLVTQRIEADRPLWLVCGYATVVALAWWIVHATISGALPKFFVPGSGGTMVRQFVVASAIAMFLLTALLLRHRLERPASAPAAWYESGLWLMALGLACIWIQKTTGGWVGWYGRGAQYLGGICMLVASIKAVRGGVWRLTAPLAEKEATDTTSRLTLLAAIGIAGVLVTGAIHLLVLEPTDPNIGFLTFLPAVIFAVFLGGGGAGAVSSIMAVLLVLLLHFGVKGHSLHSWSAELLQFLIFFGVSVGVAAMASVLRRSRTELVAAIVEKQHALRHGKNAQALQDLSERLENVIEGTRAGIWDWEIVSGALAVNGRWAEIVGYSLDELAPISIATWQGLAHPEDLACSNRLLERVFSGEEAIYDCECRMRHRHGGWIWVRDRGKVVRWSEDGRPLRMIGSHIDITARKLAEEGLRESERNFRSIVETLSDLMVVASFEGRILFANRQFRQTLGFTEEVLGDIHLLDLHPPPLRAEAEKIFAAMLRKEQEVCPLPIVTKGGTVLPVETRVWVGMWSGKECIFGLIRDLTPDQEQRQRFEALFRHNPSVMAITAHPHQIFVDVNEAFVQVLGYEHGEVVGKTADQLGLFVEPESQHDSLAQLLRQRRIRNHEHQVRHKNGSVLHGLFSGEIINTQGREYHITVMVDLTERLRVHNELLRAKERAERADDEKSRLLSVIAHEFRTPLALLNSSLDILERYRERLGAGDIELQEQHIRSALAQLKSLVDVSQSYNWLQTEPREPQRDRIVLRDFLEQVAREAEIAWADGHDLSVTIVGDSPTIDSDEVLLRSILGNLLANAFRYTPAGGRVRLMAANQVGALQIVVEDDGIGIPPHDLPAIFQPFIRGGNIGSKRGMGLGLSIAKLSVEKLHGSIDVVSELGRGTKISLLFPHPPEISRESTTCP